MQPSEGLFTRQLPGDRYREQTDPVLQLEAINVSFDGFQALTDLSLNCAASLALMAPVKPR